MSLPILSPLLLFEGNATGTFLECLEVLRVLPVIFLVVGLGWPSACVGSICRQ